PPALRERPGAGPEDVDRQGPLGVERDLPGPRDLSLLLRPATDGRVVAPAASLGAGLHDRAAVYGLLRDPLQRPPAPVVATDRHVPAVPRPPRRTGTTRHRRAGDRRPDLGARVPIGTGAGNGSGLRGFAFNLTTARAGSRLTMNLVVGFDQPEHALLSLV